jgi:TIR domain
MDPKHADGQSPKPASMTAGAVFLGYASQDSEAVHKICDSLRAAGVTVWCDQSEPRGGEAWERQIRAQIRDCALFVPIISAHSDARRDGSRRREWGLALERVRDMPAGVPFLQS